MVLLGGLGGSRAWAQTTCPVTAATLNFATRPAGENWQNRATEGVPTVYSATRLGTTYTTTTNAGTTSLQTAAVNGGQSLAWNATYNSGGSNASVTFTFAQPVTNARIRVQDIDAVYNAGLAGLLSNGYVDQVTFTGALVSNGVTTGVTPTLSRANAVTSYNTISGNVATGREAGGDNTSADDATIIAAYATPVTSITLTFRNATGASILNAQSLGIDNLSWCRVAPTVANVTTAPVLSTATQVGLAGLVGQADGALTYTIRSLPAAGTLLYNTTGTTYAAVALNQTLTPAQAASLRYTPSTAFTGASTSFTYSLSDDATPVQTSGTATYTIPLQYPVACAPGTATPFAFGSRPAGENWQNRPTGVAAPGTNATFVSSSNYSSGAPTASVFQVSNFNGVNTLGWQNDYAPGNVNSSSITFNFSRPVSNFTVKVQDIDVGTDYIDRITFVGANGGTTVVPALLADNPGAGIVAINGNVATGVANTASAVDGTVTAYFGSPITSLTITYANVGNAADPAAQVVGIDQMTWCEAPPVALDVTTPTVLSSVGAASISALASTIDSAPASYVLASLPTTAQGVLSYNSTGSTYTDITAANFASLTLTAAQAASLRFAPAAGTSGNVTFTYRAKDGNNQTSASAATYTIPVSNAACVTTASLNFRNTTPVPDDWRAHAALAAPAGSAFTTISSGGFTSPATATTSSLATVATASGLNGVQTLQWMSDYANTTDNTSTVTFTFNRAVSNYTLRVQDIDRSETAAANGNPATAFIDQVTFVGSNGGTTVLPSLTALGAANTVAITGNVATGTTNITNTTDGTVTVYFASPVTSVTITYRNLSTFQADPTANAIGLEEMTWCRLAPVAANITNTSRPAGQAATAVNALSATADGTVASYTIAALPPVSQGIFYVNGVALTSSTLTLTPAQAAQLSFAPAAGFGGTAGFSYVATDDAGTVSSPATYAVPVSNTGAAGTASACAIPGKDGSPTLLDNPNTYYPATASAAAGATSLVVGVGTRGSTPAASNTIAKGDLLLVIQMQGADINSTNTDSYGDGVAGGGASGNLTSNLQAGTYEYVVASNTTPIDVTVGGTITLTSALVNSYVNAAATASAGPRRFQVVRIPQYGNLTLGATIAALPWTGSVGGILALDVAGQTNFSGNSIDASGRGFRGGGGRTQATAAGANLDYVGTSATNAHAQKGEGLAGTPRYVNVPGTPNDATTNATIDNGSANENYAGGSFSRGAPGNAGGGGNNNIDNSGGGGGANGGTGGRGGNKFAGSSEPVGGEPGAAFGPVSSARLVLGGGGGAGSTNNNTGTPTNGAASSGAAGGGIVLLRTGTVAGSGSIVANGGSANGSVADDGSGGGGAGGSILLTAQNPAGLSGVTLAANGGNGGSNTGSASGNGPHGPGGGGGGGVVLANGPVASASAAAGANGTTRNGGTSIAYGAAAGAAGIVNTQISNAIAGTTVGTTCAADVTTSITGPATLTPAQPSGTYTVTFVNEGPAMAATVTRTVTLPSGATNIFVNGAAYMPTMANTIDFGTAASMASGATSSFTFSFTPATTATGTQSITSNVTTVSGQGADGAPNASAILATVPPVADVAATIVPGAAVPAGTLASASTPPSFTATFSNNGPASALGMTATVQLPKNLTNVTASGGGVYDAATGLVSYASFTGLPNGGSLVSIIKFDAPATGPVMATASATTTSSEAGQTANNRQTMGLTLTPAFDLATSLSGPATSVAGDLVTLALTTSNNGPSAAPTVVQTAQLATGLSNVYVSNGGYYNTSTSATSVTYNGVTYSVPAGGVIYPPLASLPAGQAVANTVSFVMPASGFAPSASVAPATAAAGETSPANNLAYLNGPTSTPLSPAAATGNPANVYTKLSASAATVAVGSPITLTVTTGNNGSATSAGGSATGVVQTVQLLPGLATSALQVDGQAGTLSGNTITFLTSGATYNTLTGLVTFPAISQASGANVSHTLTLTAPASTGNNGQLLATAMVTTANVDPVPADNAAATAIVLTPATDLAATLTGPASATAGQVVSYMASFTNNGPMAASGYNASGTQTAGVLASVQLPVGLSDVAITDAAGATATMASYNPQTGVVTFPAQPDMAVGATQAYTLSFVAPARNLAVSALVSSATPDATPANNSAVVSTTIAPAADLRTSVSGPAVAAIGNAVTYTVATANAGPSAAAAVVPTLQLPTGFSGTTLLVAGQTGSFNGTTNTYDYPNGAKYNLGSGVVSFPATASLASGSSVLNYVTFLMPDASGGQVAGVASATSTTADLSPGNNATSVATSIAPATAATADLVTSLTGAPASAPAGSDLTFTARYRNNGAAAATNVMPTLQLPAGLTIGSISNGGVYSPATGLVTWPAISSQPSGDEQAYTVVVKAPANGPVAAYSSASSDTSEPNTSTAQGNTVGSASVAVTPVFDAVTRLGGPASAPAGTTQTYTVTTGNGGPSATGAATTQVVTLSAGVAPVAGSITGGGTYSSASNTITWTIAAGQPAGQAGAVANTFALVQPAAGVALSASVSVAGDSDTGNNAATLSTSVPNQQPTAAAVVNARMPFIGNTAGTSPTAPYGVLLSPLAGADFESALAASPYTVATLPNATTQGTLYYSTGGTSYAPVTAGQALTAAQATTLRFLPQAGYVGNAFFTYSTTDAAGNQSPAATYTVAVGSDLAATYATYNATKGSYANGDVLAQFADATASRYSSAGSLYDAQGNALAGTANGLSSAVLTAGTLPAGVSLDAATGRLYVSDASQLVRSGAPSTYTVTIATTDANGGVTTQPVSFTIGALPLPVVLVDFTAQAVANRDALLRWGTASEKNNDHFDIERSLDGVRFATIGQLAGHGTTSAASSYTFTDANVAAQANG
ncbi:MAG TPA: hypothetical protein VFO93_08120, partial [Hymenobacter sp.]|uniref:beta strand repeat-containing protein n=1 Tax=Hymenobacter sp. TaxID=1898978 RepID=UPI002D8D5B5D|nr:hypothetical protein [Hymenobacter sp.]